MNSKTKIGVKTASGQTRFKLLTSTAMVAMALASMSAMAGPGKVTLDPNAIPPLTSPTYYANSPAGVLNSTSNSGTALRKFVDPLPGLRAPAGNPAGMAAKYIPVAVPTKWVTPNGTVTNDDYYELGVVEYTERVHSDLANPTKMRGYVQIDQYATHGFTAPTGWVSKAIPLTYPDGKPIKTYQTDASGNLLKDTATGKYISVPVYAVDAPHALGPAVVATSGTPVRFKVTNLLPIGHAGLDANGNFVRNGDLFLPVDKSLVGAGVGPDGMTYYSENRMSVHLHGGDSPWISDGTPYQWFAPAGEADATKPNTVAHDLAMNGSTLLMDHFLKGASAQNVPDMPDAGPGSMTFFYPNNQTARLIWYHDHTVGLTRVNVAAGMAAPYLITDATETGLLTNGTLPADMIPLVIQDKTFVPADIARQDANWNTAAWGQEGDFWFPHVYETNGTTNLRNNGFTAAADFIDADTTLAGANPTGRWDFGPEVGLLGTFPPLMTGEYKDAAGKFAASTTPEGFMDTPLVNSTAYPKLDIQPKAYRFRLLNATNDRYLNLSLFEAVTDTASPNPFTEVAMIPAVQPADAAGTLLPICTSTTDPVTGLPVMTDASGALVCWPAAWPVGATDALGNITGPDPLKLGGVPDPTKAGPKMVQIGNETGWLPNTRHVPAAPALYATSQKAGDGTYLNNVGTHSMYMSPADRVDVVIDFSAYAGKTLILYNDAPAPAPGFDDRYDYFTGNADLSGAGGAEPTKPGYGPNTRTIMQINVAAAPAAATFDFGALDAALPAAFAARNESPLVDVAAAMLALDSTQGGIRSAATLQADILNADGTVSVAPVSIVDKAIVEEFDPNYGRLNAIFGIVTQSGPKSLAFADRPTEIMRDGETTLWRIAHTGVDSHPVHFHLVNVQIVARVNADGSVEAPAPEELGWKETVKMNPAQDIIVAFRPIKPSLNGFTVPSSKRMLDPSQPDGATTGFTQMDPVTGLASAGPVTNAPADFSWEYVWHCHILGHEENDFMRVVTFIPNETAPTAPTITATASQGSAVTLSFKDNANNEYAYHIERKDFGAADAAYSKVDTLIAKTGSSEVTSWSDTNAAPGKAYTYRVSAVGSNTVKDAAGVSTGLEVALGSTVQDVTTPALLKAATLSPPVTSLVNGNSQVALTWTDNSTSETGYRVSRAATAAGPFAPLANANALPADSLSFIDDTVTAGSSYVYQVAALDGTTAGPLATSSAIVAAIAPSAPATAPTASLITSTTLTLSFTAGANATSYKLEQSTDGINWVPSVAVVTGPVATATAVTAAVTGVLPATSYQFRVSSVNAFATSAPTAATSVRTLASLLAPTFGTATSVTNAQVGGADVTLNWTNTSTGQSAYKVERFTGTLANSTRATAAWTVLNPALNAAGVLPAAAMSYKDTTAAAATAYVYRLTALDQVPAMATVGVAASQAITSATGVTAPVLTALASTGGTVTLTWTDNSTNETSFTVERADITASNTPVYAALAAGTVARSAAQSTASGGVVTFTDATAVAGSIYVYRVTAVRTTGVAPNTIVSQSPASNELQIATDLATPTALNAALGAATATATPVTLTWTDASVGESSFEVQRSTDGINFASVGSVARTAAQATAINAAVTFTDATAVPVAGGVTYTYQVRALKAAVVAAGAVAASPAAASQFSTVAKVTMTIAQPTKLSVAPGTATLTTQPWLLAWVDNASNESQYLIERATITGGVVDAFGPLPTVLARSATQATSMAGAVAFTDTTAMLNTAYAYRVTAQRVVAAVAATATTPAVTATTVSSATSLEALTTLGVASAAPSTLSANAANGVSIVLSWIDNSTNETGFQVFRTLTGTAFGATPLATVARSTTQITSKGTAVTYTDATAAVGTTYDYRVDAVIPAGGATLASTLPSGVVSAGLTLSVPTTVTVSQVATGLQVGWLDTSNNETGFEVVRTQIQVVPNTGIPAVDVNGAYIPVGTPLVTLVASSATQKTAVNATRTFVDTTAVAGLMYAYTVRSVSTTGTGATALTVRSADSTPVVTASRSLVAPSKPNAVVTSATSITVSWTDLSSNETGFVIERGFIAPGSATGTVPIWTTLATIARTAAQGTAVNGTVSYVDTLVAPATQGTYQYRVTAVNQTGTGGTAVTNASSAAVTGNALDFTAPAAPTNLVQQLPVAPAVATPGTVVLTWVDPATNETGFSVQYATVAFPATGVAPAGTVTKAIAGANPNPTGGATLTGLVTGTTYYVRVAATNLVGATYTAPITVVAP